VKFAEFEFIEKDPGKLTNLWEKLN
jgi:hypothetical protein